MDNLINELSPQWRRIIRPLWDKHGKIIESFLQEEDIRYDGKIQIIPRKKNIFDAFKYCPFEKVKVVIVGTEPYVDVPLAEGLAFSIPDKSKHLTSSLYAIYQELATEYGEWRKEKSLSGWASQGVLLLNMSMTVREYCNNSHVHIWRGFIEDLVRVLSQKKPKLVYMLWGYQSQRLRTVIEGDDNLILTSHQPTSVLWYNNNHFKMADLYLEYHWGKKVVWI